MKVFNNIKQHHKLVLIFFITIITYLFFTRTWSFEARALLIPLALLIIIPFYIFTSFSYHVFKIHSPLNNTLIGLIAWSFVTYITGRLSLLYYTPVVAVLFVFFIPELYSRLSYLRNAYRNINKTLSEENNLLYILVLIFISALIIGMIGSPTLTALIPELTCDTSLYHMILPKHYLANNSIFNVWWTRVPFLPQFFHNLYLYPMQIAQTLQLRSDLIPHIFTNFFAILILQVFYKITHSWKISLTAMIIFITTPIVSWELGTAYLDIPATLMFLITLYYFIGFLNDIKENDKYLGLSIGLSFATKPMLGMFIFAVGMVFFIYKWFYLQRSEFRFKQVIPQIFKIGLFTLIPILTFYEYNLELTGNPIFPFIMHSVPNAYHWGEDSFYQFSHAISHWTKDASLFHFVKLFIKIFMWDLNEHTDTLSSNLTPLLTFGIIGPIVLAKLKKITPKQLILFLILTFIFYTTWYVTSPVMRYIIPLVAIFSLSLAYSLVNSRIVLISFLILMSTNIWKLIGNYKLMAIRTPPPVSKSEAENYVFKNGYIGKATQWLNSNTAPTDLVYTYKVSCDWLSLSRPFIGDWFGHSNFSDLLKYSKENKFVEFMNQRNISYIFDTNGSPMPSVPELSGESKLCVTEIPEASNDIVKLYKFNSHLPQCNKTLPLPEIDEIIQKSPKTIL